MIDAQYAIREMNISCRSAAGSRFLSLSMIDAPYTSREMHISCRTAAGSCFANGTRAICYL